MYCALFFTIFPTRKEDDCVNWYPILDKLSWRIANKTSVFLLMYPRNCHSPLTADLEVEHRVVIVNQRSRHVEECRVDRGFYELWKELPINSLQFLNGTHLIYLAAKRLLVNFFRMLCKWRWLSELVSTVFVSTHEIQLRNLCEHRRRLLLSIKYL